MRKRLNRFMLCVQYERNEHKLSKLLDQLNALNDLIRYRPSESLTTKRKEVQSAITKIQIEQDDLIERHQILVAGV